MKKILFYLLLAIAFLAVAGFVYAYKKLKQDIKIPPLTEIKTIADIVTPYTANEMTKGLSIGAYLYFFKLNIYVAPKGTILTYKVPLGTRYYEITNLIK